MSLLMDALKRAEASKQEAARNALGKPDLMDADTFILEPLTPEDEAQPGSPLPDLAVYHEALDADLASTPLPVAPAAAPRPQTAARTPTPATMQEEREAVRNAFAAKQTTVPPSRQPLWLALGTLGLAAVAIGGYVWYQLSSMQQGSLAAHPAATVPPATGQGQPQPAPAVPLTNSVFAPFSPSTAALAEAPDVPIIAPRREARPIYQPSADDPEPAAQPIRLTRSQPKLDSGLASGHAALERNDLDAARRGFEQALQRDPNNTDALLALAGIAQRQNRPTDAEALRQRALVANPGDPAVLAAILGGPAAAADPQAAESRLKMLLSSQPESAALNFALGNLYARQSRWAEAQQVYFNAVAAEADNPDYLFNLAVSLDHLRQARLAAQHYRLALEAATKRPAAFDRGKLEMRLGELLADTSR